LPGNETSGPRKEGSKNIHLECQLPYFLRSTLSHKHYKCGLPFRFFYFGMVRTISLFYTYVYKMHTVRIYTVALNCGFEKHLNLMVFF
jgi:hypothetical protein